MYTFLAESYWDGKKSRRRTITNLSHLPAKTITSIKTSLKDKKDIFHLEDLTIEKTIDY